MLDQYIIYNKQFQVLICRICKAGVIGVHRHLQEFALLKYLSNEP